MLTVCLFAMIKILILLSTLMASAVRGVTEDDYVRLYDDLLRDYKKNIRPMNNQSSVVTIHLDFTLLEIASVDHVQQRMSVNTIISVGWTDERLMWTPSDYGDISILYLNEEQIWAPSLYLLNSYNNDIAVKDLRTQHLLTPTGSVIFGSSGTVQTSCTLDMTYFPFDSHTCSLTISNLDSTVNDIVIEPGHSGAGVSSFFTEDEEWAAEGVDMITAAYGSPDLEFSSAQITVSIKRRPSYYLLNVITPVVSLALLSLMTFAIPVESGERLSYALATLLSLSVYIPYIGDNMPKSSLNMPVILRYLVSMFLINVLCVFFTVVVMAMRNSCVLLRGQRKVAIIFGIPFLLRDDSSSRGCFAFWRRRLRVDAVENNSNPSQVNGDSCISIEAKADLPYQFHNSANLAIQDYPHNTKDTTIWIEPEEKKDKPVSCNNVHERSQAAPNESSISQVDVDPDLLSFSHTVNRYTCILVVIAFAVMTIVTFLELCLQNF